MVIKASLIQPVRLCLRWNPLQLLPISVFQNDVYSSAMAELASSKEVMVAKTNSIPADC